MQFFLEIRKGPQFFLQAFSVEGFSFPIQQYTHCTCRTRAAYFDRLLAFGAGEKIIAQPVGMDLQHQRRKLPLPHACKRGGTHAVQFICPGSEHPAPARKDLPDELYRCVDYLKPNETELATLTRDLSAVQDPGRGAELLQGKGVKNVVVTLGGRGTFLRAADGRSDVFPAVKVPQVVDATAAGDSFTGALAVALARGDSMNQAVGFAGLVSGLVVTRKGAQTSLPSLAEVEEFRVRIFERAGA